MANILIIDDDASLAAIFKAALEQSKHEVVVAGNAAKGIELAQQNPHLILLDYILPDQSGADVLKILKAQEQTKQIPVVILSNFGQEDKIKESLYDGASEFWLKYQIGPQDLIDKVATLLSQTTPA